MINTNKNTFNVCLQEFKVTIGNGTAVKAIKIEGIKVLYGIDQELYPFIPKNNIYIYIYALLKCGTD